MEDPGTSWWERKGARQRVGAFSGYLGKSFPIKRAPRSYLPKGFEICTSSVSALLFGAFRAGKAMSNIGAVCRQQGNFQAVGLAPGWVKQGISMEISMQAVVLFKDLIILSGCKVNSTTPRRFSHQNVPATRKRTIPCSPSNVEMVLLTPPSKQNIIITYYY